MRLILKIIGWTLGVVITLAVIGGAGTYFWLRGSLPDIEGNVAASGLEAPAEITRDSHGIVHIRAESTNAAYFALGYAHAQDRLWQMEAMRRFAAGRLAEIGGERLVYQDRLMRILNLHEKAEATLPLLEPATRNALTAYANGVNAWLRNHDGALPPEFALAGVTPAPWRPADSLAWGRLMAWRLAGGWRDEMLRARLADRLGPAALERLMLPYPEDAPVTVAFDDLAHATPSTQPETPTGERAPLLEADVAKILAALNRALPPGPLRPTASNTWAVAGMRTASGRPVMANDPHLRFRAPNLWYLARLEAPGLMVAGATAAGVPFHVLGHNGRIAWGMTTTGADTADLVFEKLAPGDAGGYLAPEGVRPFITREEVIRVRGGEPVIITVRETRNGPVLSDIAGDLAGELPPDTVVSLRATFLERNDRSSEALYRFARARSWPAFTEALAHFHSPVQNLIYADTDGNIGLSVAGRIPLRTRDPGGPVPGESAAHDWRGYIPPDQLPRTFNPDGGIIVNANNRVVGPAYPYWLAGDWEPPYRAQRIDEVLDATSRHDTEASRALQHDAVSLAARELLPVLVRATPRRQGIESLLNLLAAWDGTVTREQGEPLLFHAWLDHLNERLFADELGPLYDDFDRVRPRLIAHVIERDSAWCDDTTTPETRETCDSLLAESLAAARDELTQRLGEPALWRWDDLHIARFRNLVLDWIPLIGRLSRISVATDGDNFTVNRGTSGLSRGRGLEHIHGATFRAIYDLSDLDASLFSMPAGQSGNPLSRHYRDLATDWRDGNYLRISGRPDDPAGTLRLLPRGPLPPAAATP